jgi:hypothetical protein
MENMEELVRNLAEVRETLRQMTDRFGSLSAMRIPIVRLEQQEAKLLELIRASAQRRP